MHGIDLGKVAPECPPSAHLYPPNGFHVVCCLHQACVTCCFPCILQKDTHKHTHTIKLTFNGKTGQSCSINVHPVCVTRKNTVPEWAFKLNSVLVAEKTWHLKDYTESLHIGAWRLFINSVPNCRKTLHLISKANKFKLFGKITVYPKNNT